MVSTWQPAITVRARISRPAAVRIVQPSPCAGDRGDRVAERDRRRRRRAAARREPRSARRCRRPRGRAAAVCMSAANPTIGAVPGSDIGGPDCAPNQASAALRRSSSKYSSSSASPEPRNCRDSVAAAAAPCRAPRTTRAAQMARVGASTERAHDAVRCADPTPRRTGGRRRHPRRRRPPRWSGTSRRGCGGTRCAARSGRRRRGRTPTDRSRGSAVRSGRVRAPRRSRCAGS